MSSPEHIEIIAQETLKPYVPGGIEFVERVVNKGRIPKAERTLTKRERNALKDQAAGRVEAISKSTSPHELLSVSEAEGKLTNMTCGEEIELDYGGSFDGMLFTFKPSK